MIGRLNLINESLRHEDIEGLLSNGAPNDEYESEAKMIADRMSKAEQTAPSRTLTTEDVTDIITDVWKEMFDLSEDQLMQRRKAFHTIAIRLIPRAE